MKNKALLVAQMLMVFAAAATILTACKYDEVLPVSYPASKAYMTTGLGANGVYNINDVPAPPVNGAQGTGQFQFTVDLTGNKLNIPLSVNRSGITADDAVAVNITANADTLNKLVTKGVLTGITTLPNDKYVLPASVTIQSGQIAAPFVLSIDLNYLRANTTKVFAFAVSINSSQIAVNPNLNSTVLVFDAKLLKPIANFTTTVNATAKAVTFANTSTYGVAYSWNFGDGTAVSTDKVPPVHTYTAPGTYNVTLTTTGVTGAPDASVKTVSVVIP